MSPRRTRTGPAAYRAALALAAGVVVVRSVLLAVDGVERLQALGISDPLFPALAVLLALLLGPYVQEVEAGGVVVRREDGARATAEDSAELAAGEGGAVVGGRPSDHDVGAAAARLLGVQLALAGAPVRLPELAGYRLHLHVPDDTGRLVPVLEHDDPDRAWSRGWDPGSGVVGRAFLRRRLQAGRGEALRAEVTALAEKPAAAFARLEAVLAVPLLNAAGRPVGVLSAASDDAAADPTEPRVRRTLEALAAALTRVLVDLVAWDTDGPGPGPGAAAPHTGG